MNKTIKILLAANAIAALAWASIYTFGAYAKQSVIRKQIKQDAIDSEKDGFMKKEDYLRFNQVGSKYTRQDKEMSNDDVIWIVGLIKRSYSQDMIRGTIVRMQLVSFVDRNRKILSQFQKGLLYDVALPMADINDKADKHGINRVCFCDLAITFRATKAIPKLFELMNDPRKSVKDRAEYAIKRLQKTKR